MLPVQCTCEDLHLDVVLDLCITSSVIEAPLCFLLSRFSCLLGMLFLICGPSCMDCGVGNITCGCFDRLTSLALLLLKLGLGICCSSCHDSAVGVASSGLCLCLEEFLFHEVDCHAKAVVSEPISSMEEVMRAWEWSRATEMETMGEECF